MIRVRLKRNGMVFLSPSKTIQNKVSLRIQVCPKSPGFPLQSYSSDGMFRPSILLDREGSGFLGSKNFQATNLNPQNLPAGGGGVDSSVW